MTRRIVEIGALLLGVALLIAFALVAQSGSGSAYSTYDTGPNGYEALFNVLRYEGVPVDRLRVPLALRDPEIRTIAFTSTAPEVLAGRGLVYDSNDWKRLAAFRHRGGTIVYFAVPDNDPMRAALKRQKLNAIVLDATQFTNRALSEHPERIVHVYRALAGRGQVAFDERLHGYATDRTMWSVLSPPVRASLWIVLLALAIVLVDANVRFAPPIAAERNDERDSSAYIASMAALLRRARAGRAAIERFAKNAKDNEELERFAQLTNPSDAAVLRAAVLLAGQGKERS